jgi:predicted nucleic-acid-binding Zn-ribbon protein
MRKGECPKCGSHEILVSQFPAGIWNDTEAVFVGQTIHCGPEPSGLGQQVAFAKGWRTFLCTGCGYCEFYVDDRVAIDAIAGAAGEGWSRVVPGG